MKALDRHGMSENTFIFFSSDNGAWFEGNAGIYRGRKGQTLDGGMRVPGIARWPAHIPAGKVINEMSMNIDLFSTCLNMAGVRIPHDRPIDGKNMLSMLKGESSSPHDALYFYHGRKLEAVRTPKWKYHRVHKGWAHLYSPLPKKPMLIDLENDPNESYNVIDKYPEVAAKMEELMKNWEADLVRGVP